jgi:hypothetical protein
MVIAIDDSDALAVLRLFNEPASQEYLRGMGISEDTIEKLSWVGISGAANIISCIKFAKYYELTDNDMVMTVLTDSAEMYKSRLKEMESVRGKKYTTSDAAIDHSRSVLGIRTDHMDELTYQGKKRIHNLKYYTWIEQQMYDRDELHEQWYDFEDYWGRLHKMGPELDVLISNFNEQVNQ